MSDLSDVEKVYARWRNYDAPVNFLRDALVAPLEKLGYSVTAEPSGKPLLIFALPDGRRLGSMNTESFYFTAHQAAASLDTGLLITTTATGKNPSNPRTRHSSENARTYIIQVARAFAEGSNGQ